MKISIVIPTYNSDKYLDRTLCSIFMQGYKDLEILCVDGGSKDDTHKILHSYMSMSYFKGVLDYIVLPPKGEPDAINKGMARLTGDIVAFIDSDDTYCKEAFHTVADYYRKYPEVMWSYGKAKIIDENDREIRPEVTKIKELFQPHYAYWKLLCVDFITQPSVFMRREAWEAVGEFRTDYKFSFEYDYWCRLGKKYKPHFFNQYLANWRANPQAISEQSGAHIAEAWQAYKIASGYSGIYLRPIQWFVRNLQIALYQNVLKT